MEDIGHRYELMSLVMTICLTLKKGFNFYSCFVKRYIMTLFRGLPVFTGYCCAFSDLSGKDTYEAIMLIAGIVIPVD
jgi:hypothetical protein